VGGFETISLEKPLIVSNRPILRDYFPQSTGFVSNNVKSISEGIYRAKDDQEALKQEMILLNKRIVENW
jgi:hypothetical protein